MNNALPAAGKLHLIVGYDGSPPAVRALDAAIGLLRGRDGRIDVLYVARLTSLEMMSAGAVAEMGETFDQIVGELQAQAGGQLDGRDLPWQFERRQGPIADELAAAARQAHESEPGDIVVIVIGSSSEAAHRLVGSVAVSLARHAPVPLVIVP